MLTTIEKVIFLQNVDLFSDVPTEQLAHMAAIAQEVEIDPKEEIYIENDPSDSLYLVLEGRVRLHQGDQDITIAEEKEAFGSWALFDDQPRVTSATALVESRLLKIDSDQFIDLLSDHEQITKGILKAMAERLRSLMGRIKPIKREQSN